MDKITLEQILKDFSKQVSESIAKSIAKSNAEADARMKKLEETVAKTGKQVEKTVKGIDKLRKNYGGLSNNLGRETENKIFAFLEKTKKIGDILFHFILLNLKIKGTELDALLVNDKWLAILEVKRNLMVQDIEKYFLETIPKFDEYFSKSDFEKKKKLYLFGCETIAPEAMEKLKEKGCFLIQPKYKSFSVTEIKKSSSTLSK